MAETLSDVPLPVHEKLRDALLRSPNMEGSQGALADAETALETISDPHERVLIRHVLAQYHSMRGEFDLAHNLLDLAELDCKGNGHLGDLNSYLRASVLHRESRFEPARNLLKPLVENVSAKDDVEFAARIHTLYAGILDSLGQIEESEEEFHIAIELREKIGDPRGLAVVYYNFAESCLRRDEDDVALEFFIRANGIEKSLEDIAGLAQSACHIAILLARKEERDNALRYADEAKELADRSGMPMMIAHVMGNRSALFKILGDQDAHEKSLKDALDYLTMHPIDAMMGPLLGSLGNLFLTQGRFDEAETNLQRALSMAQTDGYVYNEGFWLFCLGKLRYERGEYADAFIYLTKSIELLRSVKAHVYTMEAIQVLANVHARMQSNVEAFETLAEWTRTYLDEHRSDLEQRLRSVKALRMRELKEKEEEIYRLRNVELSQALDKLHHTNTELRDLAAEKDEFMAIAAHDLRNPLGDSRGMLQTIIGHYDVLDKSDVLSLCYDLLTLTMRMSNTVHAFLEVSRTDRRGTGLVIQPVDLTLLVERALERHTIRARSKSISASIRIRKPSLWATGDASVIDAIMDNLVTNSLKYSPSGSTITLEVDEDAEGPILRVFDNGPGVAKENRHLLFTKYATMGVKPTGGEETLGLGLYLAQRMATRMGARITYEERPVGGASFVLHLLS